MSSENNTNYYGRVRSPRDDDNFPPEDDVASRGSSVSADFVDEYNQLLQYAVVLPSLTNASAAQAAARSQAPVTTEPSQRSNPIGASLEPEELASTGEKEPQHQGILGVATKDSGKGTTASPSSALPYATNDCLCPDRVQKTRHASDCDESLRNCFCPQCNIEALEPRATIEGQSPPEASHMINHPDGVDEAVADRAATAVGTASTPNGKLDMFDTMAQQMKKALRQELLQQILIEQQKSQQKLERQRQAFSQEMQQLLGTLGDAQQEIERLRVELKSKDNAVGAVMVNLEKQRKELLATRAFYRWKDMLKDKKLENYENRLADRQYEMNVLKRSIHGWKSGSSNQWRDRVKLNCQSHAEHVCHALAEKYEAKLDQMRSELVVKERENEFLKEQREEFHNQMKEAFMRGVCALNVEAMKVLSPSSSKANSQTAISSAMAPKPSSQRALFTVENHMEGSIVLENATKEASECEQELSLEKSSALSESSASAPMPSGNAQLTTLPTSAPSIDFKSLYTAGPGQSSTSTRGLSAEPLRPKAVYPLGQFRSVARDVDSLGEHSTDEVSSDMSLFSHKELQYSYNSYSKQYKTGIPANHDGGRAEPLRTTHYPTIMQASRHASPPPSTLTSTRPKRLQSLVVVPKQIAQGTRAAISKPSVAPKAVQNSNPSSVYKETKASKNHSLLVNTSRIPMAAATTTAAKSATRSKLNSTSSPPPKAANAAAGTHNNFHVQRHHHHSGRMVGTGAADASAATFPNYGVRTLKHGSASMNDLIGRSRGLAASQLARVGQSSSLSMSGTPSSDNRSPVESSLGSGGLCTGNHSRLSPVATKEGRSTGDGRDTGLQTSQVPSSSPLGNAHYRQRNDE